MSKRQALVVGAAAYPTRPLTNATEDAERVSIGLTQRGFVVETVLNPDQTSLTKSLAKFQERAMSAGIALIYLAGHAVERHGAGYFLPVDFPFPVAVGWLRNNGVTLNTFVAATDGAESRIVILDACRNWPSERDLRQPIADNLEELSGNEGDWGKLLLAYSTSATLTASDGIPGKGSIFSNSFCRHLLDHSLTIDECFRRVSQDVVSQSRQQPWTYSSLQNALSFSDLPRYTAIQRHEMPDPTRSFRGTWSTLGSARDALIVGVGDNVAWYVRLAGWPRVNHQASTRLIGAADLHTALFLAGEDGQLYVAGGDGEQVADLKTKGSFGITTALNRDGFTIFGRQSVVCLRIADNELEEVSRHKVGFDVYSSVYLSEYKLWIAGSSGQVCEVDFSSGFSVLKNVTSFKQPINGMALSASCGRVFVVGQSGLVAGVDPVGHDTIEILAERSRATAAGIRASLVAEVDDEDIRKFIFDRKSLSDEVQEYFEELVGRPSYPALACAPSHPILALGTEESTVILIDVRDNTIFQEIDIGSGNPQRVEGVHFLSDTELVVVDARGHVTFFISS